MVHPLSEEAAMQRDPPTMVLSNLAQASLQASGQVPGRIDGVGGHLGNQPCDLLWLRRRGPDGALEISHQALAFVQTAYRIEARGSEAVRLAANVVRDDHRESIRIRLVQ